ncbi:hypothetical protein Syun_023622 [Stephania yunnanensis]|uniref:Amino acid transporter transmembrane domain-containing protein n=1 Tax=Stephania yunnanensis TaxID=152371 RepID=A0AAP0I3F3_9MAGN
MEVHNDEKLETQHSGLQPSEGTTFLRTCFNGVNAMSGVGILSVPYALSEGGWFGLVLLLVMAVVCWYTGLLLRRCMNANPLIKTYADLGELAFGYKGKLIVAFFLYLELYLVAIEFLILEGDNLNKLFPNMSFKVSNLRVEGKQGLTLLAAALFLPTTWLRSMGLLAYISAGGVLASIILVVCVFWVGAVDGVGFHERGQFLKWGGMPTTVSLYAFCYCGHAVFPTLCTSMKDKRQFSKVLAICFVVCTVNYGSMAILGYLMYGDSVKSQVTLNLPVKKLSSKIAIYTTLINPFTKYAIMITPIATAIEDHFQFYKSKYSICVLIRTVLVISTVVVALVVPLFGYLMSLIGAFLSVTASMLLPCICYLKISKAHRSNGLELLVIIGILILGSLVAVLGTYMSLRQIISHL